MVLERRMRVMNESGQDEQLGLKVAFATTDMKTVNQHFGSAQQFAVYRVEPDHASLLEAAEFGKLAQDGNEDKLQAKLDVLEGCAAVYCQAVGSSAVRQLMLRGVQPIKVVQGAVIKDLLESLQGEMRQGPSAWLAKAIAAQTGADLSRFDEMEEEGWEE